MGKTAATTKPPSPRSELKNAVFCRETLQGWTAKKTRGLAGGAVAPLEESHQKCDRDGGVTPTSFSSYPPNTPDPGAAGEAGRGGEG